MSTLVTAVIAVVALNRARLDSRDRSRPIVVARFVDYRYNQAILNLVVRNYGQTVARDLRVTFDPPLAELTPEQEADPECFTRLLRWRYAKPIQTLAPDVELVNLYFVAKVTAQRGAVATNREPVPDQLTVGLSYKGPGRWRRYTDGFDLDVNDFRHQSGAHLRSTSDPESQLAAAVTALKSIEVAVTRMASLKPDPAIDPGADGERVR